MSGPFNFPVVFGSTGAQPTAPTTILSQLLAAVAATNPGYTANLPGGLIEDISSTDVGAVVLIDSYRIELLNSLTPYGCNEFVLTQLGSQAGIVQGTPTNTSVNVVFSGTVGFVINAGFIVGDGTHQYQLVDAGVILGGGSSNSLTAVAVFSGSWAVPPNSVTSLITSVPGGITLTVNNPTAGTPATSSETAQSYRARVLQAGRASSNGVLSFLRTQLQNVPGVVARSVGIIPVLGTGIEVLVQGGDNYAVALAILKGWFDPTRLVGSVAHSGQNVTVTLNNNPNNINILFVTPLQQAVTLALTWNTTLADFTQGSAVNASGVQPLVNYVNSILQGNPINVLELNAVFTDAVSAIIDASDISKMNWTVTIGGSPVSPVGTLYSGDSEGLLTCAVNTVTIVQG